MSNIIRVRMSITLPVNQPVNEQTDLPVIRTAIERAIIPAIPEHIRVDTVKVTRINMAKPQQEGEGEAQA